MGDRYMWREKCPKCGTEDSLDCYDAPSSLMFSRNCDHCDYKDPRNYYEKNEFEVVLCTEEEARQNGALIICKNCGEEVMGSYIEGPKCAECKLDVVKTE